MKHTSYGPPEILTILDQFGLSNTEKTLFMASLIIGPTSIIGLSSYTKYKRLTTHHAVAGMIEQGLFLETHYGKKRLVYANTIDGLEQVLEKKRDNLKQLEQKLHNSKHLFNHLLSSRENFPQTRLYQGIEGINTTLLEVTKDRKPVSIIYDANALGMLVDEKLFHRSYSQRSKQKTSTRLILPDTFKDYWHVERKEDYNVSIKTLKHSQIIHGGIEIRGYKVALHCYREGKITTTIIENQEIANIILMMYNTMRNSAKDYHEQYVII
ncbi:MAG TPA: hypothetical protein PLW93_04635 [Candidatus Absconditabacterales bacterium]|nr:hypothetical protein [Candidatus Absconditabacterales bacterium]